MASADIAATVDAIPIEEPGQAAGPSTGGSPSPGDGAPEQTVIAERVLSRDEFFSGFCMVHQVVSWGAVRFTRDPSWKGLAISDSEQADARKASDAIYRLAELYPAALGWMISPGNETLMCVVTVGAWSFGRWQKVEAMRGDQKPAPKPQAQPAAGLSAHD